MEFPIAIERDETVGLVHAACLRTLLGLERKEIGHVWKTILGILARIVPIRSGGGLCHHAGSKEPSTEGKCFVKFHISEILNINEEWSLRSK